MTMKCWNTSLVKLFANWKQLPKFFPLILMSTIIVTFVYPLECLEKPSRDLILWVYAFPSRTVDDTQVVTTHKPNNREIKTVNE